MPSNVCCPQCRGKRLQQITPSFYECLELVVVGMAPPEATGLPHPAPVERPCGARFQVGTPVVSPSCGFCGLDSIGTCEGGCERRLCGVHGTTRPPFLCRECLKRMKTKKAEEEAATRHRAQEARDRVRAQLDSILRASEDPQEVAQALREHEELVDRDHCREAWSRLIDALSLEPTHECVEIVGRGIRFFDLRMSASEPGRWRETADSRIEVWRAAEVNIGLDLFLTAEGEYWRSTGCQEILYLQAGGRSSRTFILPRGQPFEMVRGRGHFEVPGSIQVRRPGASKTYIDRTIEDPQLFIRAVATILEGLDGPA